MTEETLKKANENRKRLEFWKGKKFKFMGAEEISYITVTGSGTNNCHIEHTEWGKHICNAAMEFMNKKIEELETEFLRL